MNTHPRQHLTAVVMAAGLGTRMRSVTPKVLHPICGRPMLAYVLEAAVAATGSRPLVVISPPVAAIGDVFAEDADFATQAEPLGTADAIAAALSVLPDDVHEIIVLSGDVPLVDASLLAELADARRDNDAAIALVSVDMD
ncbi:MAG TPA: NTP transferase domain-containing protein, partial [Anaerolineae bacterium]|nr:NTP transferase domain-containing protein [Anaerolineae bacterium]